MRDPVPQSLRLRNRAAHVSKRSLEQQLRSKLEHARIPHARHLPEVARRETGADAVELRVIERVVRFKTQLEFALVLFAEDEAFEQRNVPVVAAGSAHHAAPQIAPCSESRCPEGAGIEPLRYCVRVG